MGYTGLLMLMHCFLGVIPGCMLSAPLKLPLIKWREAFWW